MERIKSSTDYYIRSVRRALAILKGFSYDKKERTLDEIAKSVKLSKSTAFRILQNLKEEGFVTQHKERETYSLGPEIFRLGKVLDNPY